MGAGAAGAAGAAAEAAIAQATKASGVIVRVEPGDFLGILKRQSASRGRLWFTFTRQAGSSAPTTST